MLMRDPPGFPMAKCQYSSVFETPSDSGGRSDTNESLRCDGESLCLCHDVCWQTAIRKEAAL